MEIFKPRFSIIGWIFSIALVLIMFYLFFLNIKSVEAGKTSILSPIIFGIFFIVTIFFLVIYPTMRYELKHDALWLRCGPFCYKIPYSEIKEIVKTELRYHLTSMGWKLPGYTIGKIYYTDRGYVYMCATGMCRDIILIKTSKGLFGITPSNEQRFLETLRARLS